MDSGVASLKWTRGYPASRVLFHDCHNTSIVILGMSMMPLSKGLDIYYRREGGGSKLVKYQNFFAHPLHRVKFFAHPLRTSVFFHTPPIFDPLRPASNKCQVPNPDAIDVYKGKGCSMSIFNPCMATSRWEFHEVNKREEVEKVGHD